jgi:hypothetical protein
LTADRCQVDVEFLSFFPFDLPTAAEGFLSEGKCNVTLPVKFEHKSPANPILEYAVGLNSIPFTANSQGQGSTALIRIVGDELTEKIDVIGIYGTFALSEYLSQ